MTNKDIEELLRKVAAAYAIKDDKKHYFQIVAYQKAADTIGHLTIQISDLVKENRLDGLSGIGSSMKQHLRELVKTEQVKHFDQILKGVPPAVFPLLHVPSFGPKKAYKIVKTFHLSNAETVIEDVKKLSEQGKIAELEGFGEKSQADIIRALAEFGKGAGKTTRMLLPFATELAENLINYLKKSPAIAQAFPLGSLRRKVPTVGDIDIAVATDDPETAIEHFASYPYKERIIEKGQATASLMTNGGHQVDLMTHSVAGFGSLLQHFTGSKHHNVHLRELALRKGLSLSEYGIKNIRDSDGKRKMYDTEEKFYGALDMQWVSPEMREDTGEIELAQKHALPKLIELQDMKGDLHIHSSYPIEPSHDLGKNTMEDMVKKAKSLGYEYIGFSEHNPRISNNTKQQIYSILEKRYAYLEKLKKNIKNIRIVNLLETDILPDGSLAIDDKAFAYIDATIVSIHSVFNMDRNKMTERVLEGLSHPKAKILAHPTGRLLNERSGYELDFEKIFSFCREQNKALEVNAWPERTDLPDGLIRQAVDQGVKLIIDTDSHAVEHMDLMRYGVWNARRGWAKKDDVLNCLEYNKFIEWIRG